MSDPLFDIQALRLRRGNFEIHVDRLTIPAGVTTMLLGATAAGKSTLLSVLGRIELPWLSTPGEGRPGGRVLFHQGGNGPTDLLALSEHDIVAQGIRGDRIGVVLQQNGLFSHLSVVENVAWPLRRQGHSPSEAEERARAALSRVGTIEEDRPVARLSGGESKRLAVARALALEPVALLMDEPFTGLDPRSFDAMISLTLALPPAVTPVIVSHQPRAVKALGGFFAMMEDGRVAWSGDEAAVGEKVNRFLESVEEEA